MWSEEGEKPNENAVTPSAYGKEREKNQMPKLNTPEEVDKNRRVAWGRYYSIMEENKRLREEIAWLRSHRLSFYHLFRLIRRNRKVTPELLMLAEELRKKMYDAELLRITRN